MSKKNRVVASITIHVTENGTYKVGEVMGELRRHRHDLTWTQAKHAIKEFRATTAKTADGSQAQAHIQALKKALATSFPTFQSPVQSIQPPCAQIPQGTHRLLMIPVGQCGCAQGPQTTKQQFGHQNR